MGGTVTKIPPRPPVRPGRTRICLAGFSISHHTGRATNIIREITAAHPDAFESWFYFDKNFRIVQPDGSCLLSDVKAELSEEDRDRLKDHRSSPFCWLETPGGARGWGRDKLSEWALATFTDTEVDARIIQLSSTVPVWGPSEWFSTTKHPAAPGNKFKKFSISMQSHPAVDMVAAAGSGCLATAIGHPADTLKVLLQTRPEMRDHGSLARVTAHLLRRHALGYSCGVYFPH